MDPLLSRGPGGRWTHSSCRSVLCHWHNRACKTNTLRGLYSGLTPKHLCAQPVLSCTTGRAVELMLFPTATADAASPFLSALYPAQTRKRGISTAGDTWEDQMKRKEALKSLLMGVFNGCPCHDRTGIHSPVSRNTNAHLPRFCVGLTVSSCSSTAQVIHTMCQLSWLFFPVPKVFCCCVSVSLCFCPRISPLLNSVFYSRVRHSYGTLAFRSPSMLWGTCMMPVEIALASQLAQVLPAAPCLPWMPCVPHVRCKAGQGEKVFSKGSVPHCCGTVLGQAFPLHIESAVPVLKYLKSEVFSIHMEGSSEILHHLLFLISSYCAEKNSFFLLRR